MRHVEIGPSRTREELAVYPPTSHLKELFSIDASSCVERGGRILRSSCHSAGTWTASGQYAFCGGALARLTAQIAIRNRPKNSCKAFRLEMEERKGIPSIYRSSCSNDSFMTCMNFDYKLIVRQVIKKRACVRALVGLKVRALSVDLSAIGKEAAMNPLFVLARRAVWRITSRWCRWWRRPLAASILPVRKSTFHYCMPT